MNLLFATSAAPAKSPFGLTEKRPPSGLGSLISLTRSQGHNIFFIDEYLKKSNFVDEGFLQKNEIDYVGISANNICYSETLKLLEKIENQRRNGSWEGKIIIGGPYTTSSPVETIPEFVDYIVQGEGEIAVQDIIGGQTEQRIIREERISDLDQLPFQPWDIFANLPYDYTCPWMDVSPVFTMNTSRGCTFGCTFCSIESIWGRKFTYFSAERIIAEIELLMKDYGARGIYFREDNFTLNPKRTERFCNIILEKGLDINWACETRTDTLDQKDLIELMSAAGCRAVFLGIESGSQKILDRINKNITVEQIEDVVTLCERNNIRTFCSLITGLPFETYEDYLLSKQLMERLKPFSYCFNVFVAIPKSPLYQYLLDNGLYEYIDNEGLVYPQGFDVKVRFFRNIDSKSLVDHEFKQRTEFDRELLKEIEKHKFKRKIKRLVVRSLTPSVVKKLKNVRRRLTRLAKQR